MSQNFQTESEFLAQYDASIYQRPSTSVDTVIFTVINGALQVLLVQRENFPFKDQWALVGGFVDLDNDDTLEATAKRKLFEKTGVATPYLEQFGTIGNKQRDPRGWSVTTVYFALIPSQHLALQAGQGSVDTQWFPITARKVTVPLAFDHADILAACVERLRNKVLYTSLPVFLMPETFSLGELQGVYEVILDQEIETKSFRRRMLNADILEETGQLRREITRPSMLYRLKPHAEPHFFMRNLEGASERS